MKRTFQVEQCYFSESLSLHLQYFHSYPIRGHGQFY